MKLHISSPPPTEKDDPLGRFFTTDGTRLTALAARRVSVRPPLEVSMRRKYTILNQVSVVKEILPEFELTGLKPPVTFTGR